MGSRQELQRGDRNRRRTGLLPAVACNAGWDHVLGGVVTAIRERYHMVLRQAFVTAAVGAGVVIERLDRIPLLATEGGDERTPLQGFALLRSGSADGARAVKMPAIPPSAFGSVYRSCVFRVLREPRRDCGLAFGAVALSIALRDCSARFRMRLDPSASRGEMFRPMAPIVLGTVLRRACSAIAAQSALLCSQEIVGRRWVFGPALSAAA